MKLTFRAKLFLYFVAIILFTSIPIALITYNYIYNSQKKDLFSNTYCFHRINPRNLMKYLDRLFLQGLV